MKDLGRVTASPCDPRCSTTLSREPFRIPAYVARYSTVYRGFVCTFISITSSEFNTFTIQMKHLCHNGVLCGYGMP